MGPVVIAAGIPDSAVASGNPSTTIFSSDLVEFGRFWCAPSHPEFRTAGRIDRHTFVFPETAVWIEHEGAVPFVGHPARVTMYNAGQRYTRRECDPTGDRCTWFAISDDVARDVIAERDRKAASCQRPLRFAYSPVLPSTCYRQRLLGRRIIANGGPDPLFIEESIANLFAEVMTTAYDLIVDTHGLTDITSRQRDLVEEATVQLYRHCTDSESLSTIASRLDVSVFHLCRLFRRATGCTMHAFRHRIRLIRALDALGQPDADLLGLAIDLGYSSHSHFTSVFHRQLGLVPSDARQQLAQRLETANRLP